ncbi:MAG: ATP-binding cassette domain-containing protein [Pseudomonadota bacterium]
MIEMEGAGISFSTGADFTYDLSISKGEGVGLIGPSGAGKSTLLAMLGGFLPIDRGSVCLDGKNHTASPPAHRPVSMMFQSNNVFDHLDVATNVGLGISPQFSRKSSDLSVVLDALNQVGLAGFEDRRAHTLSGGEAQRVALARALVRDRPVLLLDEPFAALGPSMRAGFTDLLARFKSQHHLTMLIISHSPYELQPLCERLVFIDKGSIAQDGPFDRLMDSDPDTPIGRYLGTRGLMTDKRG